MKKNALLMLVFVCTSLGVHAQDEAVLKRFYGDKIKGALFITWDQEASKFYYSLDTLFDSQKIIEIKDNMLNIRNEPDNELKVYIQFVNPLRYKLATNSKEIDDPSYLAIQKFMGELSNFSNVANSIAKTESDEEQKGNVKQVGRIYEIQSRLLYQWLMELNNSVDPKLFISSNDTVKSFLTCLNLLTIDLESFVYDYISSEDKTQTVNQWIKEQDSILYKETDYYLFLAKFEGAKKVRDMLDQSKSDATKSLICINSILTKPENIDFKYKNQVVKIDLLKYLRTECREIFKNYSSSTAFWINENVKEKMTIQSQPLPVFKKFLATLNDNLKKYSKPNKINIKGYQLAFENSFPRGYYKMRQYTLETIKLNLDGSEKLDTAKNLVKCSSTFTVSKDESVAFFVTSALATTWFKIPEYSIATNNGQNYVDEIKSSSFKLRPAVFLNMLFYTHSDFAGPYLQLGISYTDANYPAILLGGGCSFSRLFSISGGLWGGARKDLTNLKIGDPVADDATL